MIEVSAKQQEVIDMYQYLVNTGIEPTVKNLARHIYNDISNNSQIKVRQKIESLKHKKLWPFDVEQEKEKEKEDIEMWAMTNVFRLIKSLKNFESMKKIINVLKGEVFTKDEMIVLMELSKIFEQLSEEEQSRIYAYMNAKFNF